MTEVDTENEGKCSKIIHSDDTGPKKPNKSVFVLRIAVFGFLSMYFFFNVRFSFHSKSS